MVRNPFRLLLVLILLAAPVLPPAPQAVAQSILTSGSTTEADRALALKLRGALAELGGYDRVTIRARDGVVTLEGQVLDSTALEQLQAVAERTEGVIAVTNRVTETTDIAERLNPVAERLMARARALVSWSPLLLVAAAVAMVVIWSGFWLARRRQPWDRIAPNPFLADVLRQIVRLGAILAGLVLALDILGATALLGTILGAAGIVGLAVGFAVRDTVENFLASVMLSLRSPFRPNDLIEINGDLGRVVLLNARATLLVSPDGNHIRIPNATVFKARIVNFSRHPQRRFTFQVAVDSGCDAARAREIMLAVVTEAPFVLSDPAPGVWLEALGDGEVRFTVAGWVVPAEVSFQHARGEAIRLVKERLEAAGMRLATSSLTVAVKPDDKAPRSPVPETALPPAAATVADQSQEAAIERIAAEDLARVARGDSTNLLTEAVPDE